MSLTFEGGTPPGWSYAQWLRRALRMVRESGNSAITLFDSSSCEPTALLQKTIADAFSGDLTDRYESVFASGNPHVVRALADRYGVSSDRVLCTTGATGALSLIYRAYLKPGDHVLVETPGFDLFDELAAVLHVEVEHFQRRGPRAEIDPADVAAQIRARTRLIVLSNLHNPTGMAVGDDVLRRIGELAEEVGAVVIVDEVYREFAPEATPRTSAVHLSPAIITVNSLTKIYGLSALRCGWLVAAPDRLEPVRETHARVEFGVSKVAHAIAAHVLEQPEPFEAHWREVLEIARPITARWFEHWRADGLIGGEMAGQGCICFPSVEGVADTIHFSEWLAQRFGVIVAPGDYFRAPGHVRLGFSRDPESLEAALQRLDDGLRSYRREFGVAGSGARATA